MEDLYIVIEEDHHNEECNCYGYSVINVFGPFPSRKKAEAVANKFRDHDFFACKFSVEKLLNTTDHPSQQHARKPTREQKKRYKSEGV